jgi:hypothetical protein
MSDDKSIPNPNWVSAPYEEGGMCQSEKHLLEHVKDVEVRLCAKVIYEITSRDGGFVWYHLKQV